MCFTFDAYLVAGFTPVIIHGSHDIPIDRPEGMEGYIINITVKGKVWVKGMDGEIFVCEKNDVLIFPPGIAHHYGRHETSDCWDHFWIYFIPRPYWTEWLRWQMQKGGIGKISLENDIEGDNIRGLFNEAITWFSESNTLSESMAMNVLERIILSCYRLQRQNLTKKQDARVREICQYLDSDLVKDESLSELAARVCLSPSRLSHLFRQDTGKTINEWKENQRIYNAKNMLQNTTLSIADIALQNGYKNAFYFSRIFRRQSGMSPSAYRKSYTKLTPVNALTSGD